MMHNCLLICVSNAGWSSSSNLSVAIPIFSRRSDEEGKEEGAPKITRGIMTTLQMMTSTRTLLTYLLLTSIYVESPTGKP